MPVRNLSAVIAIVWAAFVLDLRAAVPAIVTNSAGAANGPLAP